MAPKRTAAKGRAAAGKSKAGKLKPQSKPMAKGKAGKAAPRKGRASQGAKPGPANKGGKKSAGLKAALKSAGDKMKEKVMSKRALLEKKMKEGSKHVQEKLKAKGNELRKKMKEKMEEAGHDLKHKRKHMRRKLRSEKQQFQAKMKSKKQHLKEHMQHTAHGIEQTGAEVVSGVADRLVQWRKTFEDMGWARGKMLNDWATLTLLGLNAIGIVMALPVFAITVYLVASLKHICLGHLLKPAYVVGFYFSLGLLLNATAGFFGAWLNRLFLVKFQFFLTAFLVILLFSFTAFGFVVTSKGAGTPVEGASFRTYSLSAYTGWMRAHILRWDIVKPCFAKGKFCDGMPYTTAAEFYSAPISRIQSGCCIPPPVCGFIYDRGRWRFPTNKTADVDCQNWKWRELCVNCNSCKAAFLQEVKSRWNKACIVNAAVGGGLLVILYRTWYVMRAAGSWDTIYAVVTGCLVALGSTIRRAITCRPKEKATVGDDDVLVPSWLEGTEADVDQEEQDKEMREKRSSKKQGGWFGFLRSKKTAIEGPEAAQLEEHEEQQQEQLPTHEDDDSWASPRQQQPGPALGYFPEGYLAQNPLAQPAMSPWLAANVGDDSYYVQQGYQDPYPYPYTYASEAYPNTNQGYFTDYYTTDPGQQQTVDYVAPSQDYMVDPSQAYMVPSQGYVDGSRGYVDPSQGYADPSQGYASFEPQLFYEQAYPDPFQQQLYMQDPNQADYPPY